MSERYFGLNVFLEKTASPEEVAAVINALQLIKGVSSVQPLQSYPELFWAKEQAKQELQQELAGVLAPQERTFGRTSYANLEGSPYRRYAAPR